jgi:hypothetical protein
MLRDFCPFTLGRYYKWQDKVMFQLIRWVTVNVEFGASFCRS